MNLSKVNLKLDWCSYKAASYAVLNWHYSQRMPKGKLVRIGVWEDSKFIGCLLFGDGANKDLYKGFNLSYEQGCELVRIALRSHKSPVSRICSIALKMLKKEFPSIKLILSFADPEQSHVGTIYQAMNWFYLGKTSPADEYLINGKRWHGRAIRSNLTRYKRPANCKNTLDFIKACIDKNASKVSGSSKYRYAYALDKTLKTKLKSISLSYPKLAVENGTIRSSPSDWQFESDPTALNKAIATF